MYTQKQLKKIKRKNIMQGFTYLNIIILCENQVKTKRYLTKN